MDQKTLLKTYIKQAKRYKQMLELVNNNGRHSAKIRIINAKLKKAQKALKAI